MLVSLLGLSSSFVCFVIHSSVSSASGSWIRSHTAVRAAIAALPQGSSLWFGLFCPDPSSLNRPHPSHSQAQRDFTAWRFIRAAFAVRERLGDPQVAPGFRCLFRLGMCPLRPRRTPQCYVPSDPTESSGLRPREKDSAFSKSPPSERVGPIFRGFPFRFRYNLPSCLPPCRIRRRLLPGFRRVGRPSRRRV